jgi:hypothetical protein
VAPDRSALDRRLRRPSFIFPVVVLLVAASSASPLAAQAGSTPFGIGMSADEARFGAPLLGTRTVEDTSWPEVMPAPGVFLWGETDDVIRQIGDAGVETMFKVKSCAKNVDGSQFWGTPPAIGKAPPGVCVSMKANNMSEWADFIYQLVNRYKTPTAAGYTVRYFAINNEANAPNQWPGSPGRKRCVIDEPTGVEDCPVFGDYMKMLRRARAAAHRANPDVVILDSGLGSRTWGTAIARDIYQTKGKTDAALNEAVTFYNDYYKLRYSSPAAAGTFFINPFPAGTLRQRWETLIYAPYDPEKDPLLTFTQGDRFYYFAKHIFDDPTAYDALQLHFYDNWNLTDDVVDWIHKQMDERWGPGHRKPILCWECGSHWPLVDADGDGLANYFNYDVDDHASWLAKRFILGLSRGMAQLIHLPLTWGRESAADEQFRSPPLVCARGSKTEPQLCNGVVDLNRLTPIGKAFRQIAGTLLNYSSVTPVTLGAGVEGYRFQFPASALVAVWSVDGSTRTVDLNSLGSVQAVSDQYGVALSGPPLNAFPLSNKVTYVRVQ